MAYGFGIPKDTKKAEVKPTKVFGFSAAKQVAVSPATPAKDFPDHLGGGAYYPNQAEPNKPILEPRAYAGVKTQQGSERDHIFPVALGGSSSTTHNIKMTEKERARSNAALENQVIKDFKAGKISLAQARHKVITAKQVQDLEDQGVKQGTLANLPSATAETLKGAGKMAGEVLTGFSQKLGNTYGNALAYLDPNFRKMRDETVATTNQTIDNLMRAAKQEKDPARKQRLLISALETAQSDGVDIYNNPELQKSAKQIAGESVGTLAEILSFGTYGTAAKGMKAGVLTKATPSAVKGMTTPILAKQPVKEVLKTIVGESAKQGLKTGAPLGGVFSLAGSMAERKSNADNVKDTLTGAAMGFLFSTGLGVAGRTASQVSYELGPLGKKVPKIPDHVPPAPGSTVVKPQVPVQNPKDPNITYSKADALGVDGDGKKILARTEVDYKTGKATVYYDKSLEKTPSLLKETLDHEHGHILDKQLGGGTNISAQASAYGPNKAGLDASLSDLAKKKGVSTQELSAALNSEVQGLGQGVNSGEKFADAVKQYRADPVGFRAKAPTLADLIDSKSVAPKASLARAPKITPADVQDTSVYIPTDGMIKKQPIAALTQRPAKATTIQGKKVPAKIEESVLQRINPETNEVEFKVIKKGELTNFHNLVDDSKNGIAGNPKDGNWHLTAHTPEFMADKAKYDGVAMIGDVPNKLGQGVEGGKLQPKLPTKNGVLKPKEPSFTDRWGNKDTIIKAFKDIEDAKVLRDKAPLHSSDPAVKTKQDYEKYIGEVQAWLDKKERLSNSKQMSEITSQAPKEGVLTPKTAEKTLGVAKIGEVPKAGVLTPKAKIAPKYKNASEIEKAFESSTGDSIQLAKNKIGGVAMRNGMREAGNLAGPMEKPPYSSAQLEMIKLHDKIKNPSSTHLFHTTKTENIESIAKEGLVTGKKARFEGVSSGNKISLSANEEAAKYYGGSGDTMLRVKKDYAKKIGDLDADLLSGGDGVYTTGKNIPPEALEMKVGNKWVSVSSYKPAGVLTPKTATPTRSTGVLSKTTKQPLIAGTGFKTERPGVSTSSFNKGKINAPEDVVKIFDQMDDVAKNFQGQRISKGNKEIQELARMSGLTEAELLKAKPGSVANAETVTKARQLVLDAASDLKNYVTGIDPANMTKAQAETLKNKWTSLVGMQKSVAGLRTEASNAFRSFGISLQPGENAAIEDLAHMLKKQGIASGDDVAMFAGKVAQPLSTAQKVGEGALSTWYSAILSGPKTTSRNVLSTGANVVSEYMSKVANPKEWKTLPQATVGLLKGAAQGFREGKLILQGKLTADNKFIDNASIKNPFDTNFKSPTLNKVARKYGDIVESVGKLLSAEDRFFVGAARGMEEATLKAKDPKITEALSKALSSAYGESTAYHGIPKGRVTAALRDTAMGLRKKLPETKIIIPFVNTVANVVDRKLDYLPIASAVRLSPGHLERQAENIIREYGLKAADKTFIVSRLRDQQIGRLVLGTGVAAGAVALAKQGNISGVGPSNFNERSQLEQSGWRPNSIKIGDTWYPYQNWGPLAGMLAMAGNVHDATKYDKAPNKTVGDLVSKGLVGWMKSELNQSFLSGVSGVFEVMNGDISADKYAKNLAAGLVPVPALYSQTREMIDPRRWVADSLQDKIQLKLGITKGLEPRLDVFGNQQKSDLILGMSPSKETKDPVVSFLVENELIVSKPSSTLMYQVPDEEFKRVLTPSEYTEYIRESGTQIYEAIQERLDELNDLDQDEKKKEVEKIVRDIRKEIRDEILAR